MLVYLVSTVPLRDLGGAFEGDETTDNRSVNSKMNSPTTLGNATKFSRPTNSWEQIGAKVNEGPGELQRLNLILILTTLQFLFA